MNILFQKLFKKQSFISIILLSVLMQSALCADYFTKTDLTDAKEHAFAFYNTNQNEPALKILENIPKEYRDEQILLIMANIYEDKNDFDSAYTFLNQAIRVNPKFYKAYYNLGCLLMKKKDFKNAIQNFNASLGENREFAYSYYNIGCCYLELKDYKRAKKNFIRAAQIEPSDKNISKNLAYTYKMLGNEKAANKILESLK